MSTKRLADNSYLAEISPFALVGPVMTKPLLIIALVGEILLGVKVMAQDPAASPWKVEALDGDSDIRYDLESGEMRASKGVRVTYKAGTPGETVLTSNSATLKQKSGEVIATGDVNLHRDGVVWKSERIEYNFRTQNIKAAQFISGSLKTFIKGESMIGNQTNGVYRAQNTIFTTNDNNNPDFYIKAKEVEVAPGEYAIFHGATFYVGKVPIFYLPYYKRNLRQHPWNIHLKPGYKSEWGGFLLSSIRWPGDETFNGEFNLDYRTERGIGLGPTIGYENPQWGEGNLNLYRAYDDDPLTDSRGHALDRERDLLQWSHRLKRGGLTAIGVLIYEFRFFIFYFNCFFVFFKIANNFS